MISSVSDYPLPPEALGAAPLDRTHAQGRFALMDYASRIIKTTRVYRVERGDIWRYLRSLAEKQAAYGLPKVALIPAQRHTAYYAIPNDWMTEHRIVTPDSGPEDGLWAAMLLGWHALHYLPESPFRFSESGALLVPQAQMPDADQQKARFCWDFCRYLLGY